MGPQGTVDPSFKSILQSYGLCLGSASADSLPIMSRYWLNSAGT